MRWLPLLFVSLGPCYASIVIPNTNIRLFDMEFIRVDIVKCDDNESGEKKTPVSEGEDDSDCLEDDTAEKNEGPVPERMNDDSSHSKDDFSFLEPLKIEMPLRYKLSKIISDWP